MVLIKLDLNSLKKQRGIEDRYFIYSGRYKIGYVIFGDEKDYISFNDDLETSTEELQIILDLIRINKLILGKKKRFNF